jgi:uncharacterized protein DUF3768
MSTPYDEEPAVDTARIRELNDTARRNAYWLGVLGQLVFTKGVVALGSDAVDRAVRAVREYADFTEDNDPHGEHDFGRLTLDETELFWKIDCYDTELKYGSPNAADPAVTRRVLTILLAEEY